jgi:mono/diheme cytochrome c family protein
MKSGQFVRFLAATCVISVALLGAACGDDSNASPDAALADAGVADAVSPDADTNLLSSRGLFSDIATHTVAEGAIEYTPLYGLWSDAAAKRRWLKLPAGTTIDTSDMDHWSFPVGTQLWKEFATPEGQLLETRLIEKLPDGTFFFGAFVWDEGGKDAKLTPNGASNVLGTMHDVPSKARCLLCHKGEAGRVLGFSALQLSKDDETHGPTLKTLAAAGLLSDPPPAGTDFRFPGDDKTRAALGYLHANCGHCHTPEGTAYMDTCKQGMDPPTDCMQLRFSVADANDHDPLTSAVVTSLLGHLTNSNSFEGDPRLTPRDPQNSAIYVRPSHRGGTVQMPPAFSTEVVDDEGLAAIEAWIDELPQ